MLDPYDDELAAFYAEVEVRNPKLEPDGYISYEIAIETNNLSFSDEKSAVRRRYSDFVVLHKLISKEFPAMKTPSLPPKYPFQDHYHPAFIEKRRGGLEEFVKKLVSQKMYLSSKALHLFLQSSHSIPEIKSIIQGKNFPVESQKGLLNAGSSNFYSSCNSHENSSQSSSSPAELEVSMNSFPDSGNNSDAQPNVSKKCDTQSPMGSKKVSFCEQVIVAQIHSD